MSQEFNIFNKDIAQEAIRRGISVSRVFEQDSKFLELQFKLHVEVIRNTVTRHVTYIEKDVYGDKFLCMLALRELGFRVPETWLISMDEIHSLESLLPTKAVCFAVKPRKDYGGKGVSVNVARNDLVLAAKKAIDEQVISAQKKVVIQSMVTGDEYRILIVNHQDVFMVKRECAYVLGDGKSTIKDLIDSKNQLISNSTRFVHCNDELMEVLDRQELTLSCIPVVGQKVMLSYLANSHKGGMSIEMSDKIPDHIRKFAIDLSKKTRLKVVGIDIMTPNIQESYGHIIELNLTPGLTIHNNPTIGKSSFPEKAIIDMLFPETKQQ